MLKVLAQKYRIPLFFGLLFILYWKSPDTIGVNTMTRWNLTKAIVLDHSFQIDPYVKESLDWSHRDGHYYTNKAPGSSFLSVPVYFVFVQLNRWFGIDPRMKENDLKNIRRVDNFSTALPSVILSFLLLNFLLAASRDKAGHAWLVVFIYAVATLAFPYSSLLWGHQTAAAFLFFCFYFLVSGKSALAAGLFFGMAVLTEYTTALAAPGLMLILFSRTLELQARLYRLLKFALGGLPTLVLFAYYHKTCFGGWLTMPTDVRYLNPVMVDTAAQPFFFGVMGIPSLQALWGITFSFDKGLFLLSPILLLGVMGLYRWFKDPEQKTTALAAVWFVVICIFSNICFNGWHGGWCAGPRYLVWMLPFLSAAIFWIKPAPWHTLLIGISVLNMISILAVDMHVPNGTNLFDYIYSNLISHRNLWPQFAFMCVVAGALFYLATLRSIDNKFPSALHEIQ